MNSITFDVRDFQRALGEFPTGVTASSFNSVSTDPALVLWSIDKSACSTPVYKKAEHCIVNVLRNDQVSISSRFACRGEDKFSGVETVDGVGSLEAKGFVSDYLLYLLRQAHSDCSSQIYPKQSSLSFLKTCFTTIPCAYPGAFLYQDKRKSYGAE